MPRPADLGERLRNRLVAYCPPKLLDDLADLLANVRSWPGVREKHRHVFYLHNEPFFHFHLLKGDRRRADIKGQADWVQLDLPRPLPAIRRRALLRELRARYGEKARVGDSRAERQRVHLGTAAHDALPAADRGRRTARRSIE
jgi:hypothetical protein